jgi:UDP-galactopyranose mutase
LALELRVLECASMPSSSVPEVIVVGAGPAGLGAGLALGPRALVLEQAEGAGGLSGSFEFEGAVFDRGGHSFHTPHPHVRKLVEQVVELFDQPRDARCFSHGCLIPYPFQKHFRELTDERVVLDCADGLRAADVRGADVRGADVRGADASQTPANFLEFLQGRFGPGIGRHFLIPYNRKLWGAGLARLAADWVGERVAAPEGVHEVFDERGGKRRPLQPDTRVAYPARGGFGTIMTALAERLPNIRYRQRVLSIDPRRRTLATSAGETHTFRDLVSTLPLPALVAACHGAPPEIREAAQALECLSLKVVLIVIGHPVDTEIQRIYCADDTVPAHKLALNHNSSDYLRSLPRHGIMAEVSCANGVPSDNELVRWTLDGLSKMGIVKGAGEVVATRVLGVEQAYPVPTLARDSNVARIRAWLAEHRIHTLGRFGEWAYINSDEALHRGLQLGATL